MPRIYTRQGDDGTTGLLYGGRVSKADPVTEACGTVDEAVAILGLAGRTPGIRRPSASSSAPAELFVVGADLATNPDERGKLEPGVSLVTEEMAGRVEARIDELVAAHPLPNAFVVPGANPASASLDVARSVIRRAERRVVEILDSGAEVNNGALRYLEPALGPAVRRGRRETEPASR